MDSKQITLIHNFIDGQKDLYPKLLKIPIDPTATDCYSLFLKAYTTDNINEMLKQKALILKSHQHPKYKKDIK
jgi:hypothetical protein